MRITRRQLRRIINEMSPYDKSARRAGKTQAAGMDDLGVAPDPTIADIIHGIPAIQAMGSWGGIEWDLPAGDSIDTDAEQVRYLQDLGAALGSGAPEVEEYGDELDQLFNMPGKAAAEFAFQFQIASDEKRHYDEQDYRESIDKMKITKRQLRRIIKEGEMSQIVSDEPPEDDMTHGEYYASRHMGLAYNSEEADVLDEFSAAIRVVRDAGVSPKDVLAFVQQVLGDAQSDEIIDVQENKMKITKRQLRRIIREEAMNEGLWDTLKSAVGMGKNPEDMTMEIQAVFEKMGNGVGAMIKLGGAGSNAYKKWNTYVGSIGEERPEDVPGRMPSEMVSRKASNSYGNIWKAIGDFELLPTTADTLFNVAPETAAALDKIIGQLGNRPTTKTARALRNLGAKFVDEYESTGGNEDELESFYNSLQVSLENEQLGAAYSPAAWWELYKDNFINENRTKITRRQLRRIIKEEKRKVLKEGSLQGAEERFSEALSEYVMILDENLGYDIPNEQLKAEVMNLVNGYFEYLESYEKNPEMYQ